MFTNLILFVLTAGVGQGETIAGQVSSSSRSLTLNRAGVAYRAKPGVDVVANDLLSTSEGEGAGILLDDQHVVTLAPMTTLSVRGAAGRRILVLEKGEVRVVAGHEGALTVRLGQSDAEIRHGILRAAADGSALRVERGFALIHRVNRPTTRLEEGRELSSIIGSRPVLASSGSHSWKIHPDPAPTTPALDRQILLAMQSSGAADVKRQVVKPTSPAASMPKPEQPEKPGIPGQLKPPRDLPKPPNPNSNNGGPEIPPPPEETDPARSVVIPNAPVDEANRTINGQPIDTESPDNPANRPYQPIAVAQPTSSSSISLALGNISASSSAASSGALFSDAQQDSRNLLFPGNIHLITAESRYQLNNVRLIPRDRFPTMKQFWAIGVGPVPTGQVITDFRTASNTTPTTVRIPGTHAYLVRFDQVGLPDLATSNASSASTAVGIFGLLGANPIAPQIVGAKPLVDNRAQFNQRATFALGELALEQKGSHPVLDIRRSDQDRQIIKSPKGDNSDQVTPNKDVRFMQVTDAKFFPDVPKVFVPAPNLPGLPTVAHAPTYGSLDFLRKAAATTLLADSLQAYSRRTGQTRFVVDNRIVDIAGYKARPANGGATAMQNALLRSGHAAPGMAGGPISARHGTHAAGTKKHR